MPHIVPNFIALGQIMYEKMLQKCFELSMTDRPTKNSKQHVSAYHAVTIITKPGLDISYRRKSSCDGGLSSLMAFSAKKAEN